MHNNSSLLRVASCQWLSTCSAFYFGPSSSLVIKSFLKTVLRVQNTVMRIGSDCFLLRLIRILLLIKVMQICDHWSTDFPQFHFERPRLHLWASTTLHSFIFWAATAPKFWVLCGCGSGSGFLLCFGSGSVWGLCVGFELLLVCGRREPPWLDPSKTKVTSTKNT